MTKNKFSINKKNSFFLKVLIPESKKVSGIKKAINPID